MSSNCQTCTKKDTCIIFEKINNDNKASLYSSVYNLTCDLNENKLNENKLNENKLNEDKLNEDKLNENKLNDEIINNSKNYLNDAIDRLASIASDLEDIADYLDDLK